MASADRLIEVFNEAKARPTEAERQRFVAKACQGDSQLKQQVLSLLQAHDGAADFLQPSPLLSSTVPITEKPGDRIGRYKLLQQIGEGGCGVVYMAEQEEPVRRRVALKVIKLGMDTKQVIARFEAERQALALMDHPNIAKVLDGGATDTGRPYFVMELVRGIKITDYCDQNNLPTKERLKLFTQVCYAIQHAHQKGIIHRDIKPSNILVTISEPSSPGSPKIIDFGIAKATTDQRLTDKTVFTAFEQFIGTPAYMSPEQAMMTSLDIDTRTDIYALGVLLYELITGQTPFDAKDLMAAGLDAMRRIIHEQEPARPSTRLSTMLVADLTIVAKHRQSEPAKLGPLLRGDLDWIVMKALEKDRSRRYESASGLAMDIQRHLSNEPVIARPPSTAYRFQKLVRRNQLAVGAVSAVTMALVLGLCVTTWALAQERRAHREAEASGNLARAEAARNEAVNKFFVNSPTFGMGRGQDTKLVRAMLDDLSWRADTELIKRPDVQGDIWTFIASRSTGLDDYPTAITNLQKAAAAYGRAYTNATPRLARALGLLGKVQSLNKESLAGKTNALLGVAIARRCGDSETLAACLLDAAKSFSDSGEPTPEAIPLLREAMHLRRSVVPNYFGRIESTRLLAKALAFEGKKDEAKALAQKALEEAPSDTDLRDFLHRLDSAPAEATSNRTDR